MKPRSKDDLEAVERSIGAIARQKRLEAGLSQAEVAERMRDLGFSVVQTTIAKIEAGTRPIRVSEMLGYANALNLPWQEILDGVHVIGTSGAIVELEEKLSTMRVLEKVSFDDVMETVSEAIREHAQVVASRLTLAEQSRSEAEDSGAAS